MPPQAMPVMIFVGNMGCIQIHGGPVEKIVPMGPWINVMDPRFNLHLRADHAGRGLPPSGSPPAPAMSSASRPSTARRRC
jgi:hypothetical protein